MKNDTPKYAVGDAVCADFSHLTPFAEAKIKKVFYVQNVDDTLDNGYIYQVVAVYEGSEIKHLKKFVGQGGIQALR